MQQALLDLPASMGSRPRCRIRDPRADKRGAGPLSLTLHPDAITIRRRRPSTRASGLGPRPGSWESRRQRTDALPRLRIEQALREAVRLHSQVVALPSGDKAFAAPLSRVIEALLYVCAAAGLSLVAKAVETDFQRGRNAAVLDRTVEVVHDTGLTYLRPCWIGTATNDTTNKKELH
jgi:hypothetical protein